MEKDSPSSRTTKSSFFSRSAHFGNVSPFLVGATNAFSELIHPFVKLPNCVLKQQPHILQFVQSPRLFRLSPSSRSRHRLCCRTATSTHFWSTTIYTTFRREATLKTALELLDYTVKIRSQVQTITRALEINHRVYQIHQEGGVENWFLTARRHIWPPWSERTHCMENGQSFFFSLRHTPYGGVRLARMARKALTPRFIDFFTDFEKKNRLFCSLT